jgi:putative membrane protein
VNSEAWTGIYCGPAPDPAEIWLRWNLDPALLLGSTLLALLLGRSRAGAMGLAVLAFAFVSPLCALSAALFSARVVHHVLLVAIAAPLIAMALPARKPGPAGLPFVVSTIILWGWHLPQAYDLALAHVGVYWAMQVTLVVSAVAFWRAVFAPAQVPGHALLFILGAYMQMAALGALLTFAPAPLYAIHAVAPAAWGFSPLGDQQLAGLIMWVPAGLPFIAWGALVARRHWRILQSAA